MAETPAGQVAYVDFTITIETTEFVSIRYPVTGVEINNVRGKLTLDPLTKLNIDRLNAC